MEEKTVEKIWGSEEWIVNTEKYCFKKLNLKKGFRCSIHYHKNKDETFVIDSGVVYMESDGKKQIMKSGDKIRILPGMKHRFSGIEDSVVLEISTHHDDKDSYREIPSGKIEDFENWKKNIMKKYREKTKLPEKIKSENKKQDRQKIKVQFCPKCGGTNVGMMVGGITGLFECKDCGIKMPIFPEKEIYLNEFEKKGEL